MEANDIKAMREALEFADRELRRATEDNRYGQDLVYLVGCMRTVSAACRAALAAPARNCDVGTAEGQTKRFGRYCDRYDSDCTGCPCHSEARSAFTDCFAKWAQMPYKERDKKKKEERGCPEYFTAKEGGTK